MFRNFVHEIVRNLSVEVGHRLQTMLPIVVWQTYGLGILHFAFSILIAVESQGIGCAPPESEADQESVWRIENQHRYFVNTVEHGFLVRSQKSARIPTRFEKRWRRERCKDKNKQPTKRRMT